MQGWPRPQVLWAKSELSTSWVRRYSEAGRGHMCVPAASAGLRMKPGVKKATSGFQLNWKSCLNASRLLWWPTEVFYSLRVGRCLKKSRFLDFWASFWSPQWLWFNAYSLCGAQNAPGALFQLGCVGFFSGKLWIWTSRVSLIHGILGIESSWILGARCTLCFNF